MGSEMCIRDRLPRSLQEAPKEAPRGSQGLTQRPKRPPRASTRGATRLPRGAKWLSEGPKIDQEASKRPWEGRLSLFRAPDLEKTTLERVFFEPLRSPRARKQSRKVVSQASSSNGRSNGRRGFEALRNHLEQGARRSGRSSGRRRFEALTKPLASKRLSWKRLR